MIDCSKEIRKFHDDQVTLKQKQQNEMRERRNTNRDRVKKGLKDNDPIPIGFRTQGSYAMRTMIQDSDNDYDIDDGIYFRTEDLGNKSSYNTRRMIKDAVDDSFKTAPEVKKNCVRVYYEKGYHVDLPSYRRIVEENIFGDKIERYELASTEWKESDPKSVTDWFNQQAKNKSPVDDSGQFKRIVRYLKKFGKSRKSWSAPSGFIISVLVSESYEPHSGRDDESLYYTMKSIKNRLEGFKGTEVKHPVIDEFLAERNDPIIDKFKEHLQDAIDTLSVLFNSSSEEEALKEWSKVFNNNFFNDEATSKNVNANTFRKTYAGIAATSTSTGPAVAGTKSWKN